MNNNRLFKGKSPGKVRENLLEKREDLDNFIASVEHRAFVMARLATGNSDDALDLVQDGMLDFVRSYAHRPEEEWKTLFFRVMHSRIMDWHRRTSVRNRFRVWLTGPDSDEQDEEPLARFPDPSSPDGSKMLLRRETGEKITAALRALPARQRQAFLLRVWEELDVAETSRAMGCSQGSVKTHLFRAMQALRLALKDYMP